MSGKRSGAPGNFVSEWFGHRVHPTVISTTASVTDQQSERCPFLSDATNETRQCIKADAARGVCTISSVSNGPRQDWLVCPYRALSDDLVKQATRQLFALSPGIDPYVTPALTLRHDDVREDIAARLNAGQPVFIYFDKKTSGELSIPATDQSPEFSFDVTIVEMTMENDHPHIGRFGILEIQTMDFHGSYRDAVRNLREGLRMHPTNFGKIVQENQWWLSEGVEGPNIANVFKRTFYQMMFKFQLGHHERCAGCVLAIPTSVWDSWQRHLGSPVLADADDGTVSLLAPGQERRDPCPAWIYVFEPDVASGVTPSPIVTRAMIGTDAAAISHWALEVAPAAALSNIDSELGLLAGLSRRLKRFWPELARTVMAEVATIPVSARAGKKAREPSETDIPLTEAERLSDYRGPSDDAVSGGTSDV